MIEINDFQASDLEQTILINEEIKRIVSSSAEIRLAAISAMLTARRSGKASLGFAVVSTGLRTFSRQLDGHMHALSELIARLIYSFSRMSNQSRIERILKTTLDQSDKACEMLGKTVDQKVAQMRRIVEGIARDWHISHAEGFHRRWMGSNAAKNNWCERISKLDIEMLCPQHGAIYQGQDVRRFIDWFSELTVGTGIL